MEISVEKVASLAYLKLSSEEKTKFEKQFKDILDYVDQLQKVPMSSEEAKQMGAFHVQTLFYESLKLDPSSKLRDDLDSHHDFEKLILNNKEAVGNAPAASGLPNAEMFEVPSIIKKSS